MSAQSAPIARFARSPLLRTSVALAAAAAVTVAAVPTASATVAGHRIVTHNRAKGAAGWLSQQLVGGNHLVTAGFPDPGGSADVVFALAGAHVGRSSIHKIVTYLRKHVVDYTSVSDTSGAPGPYDGSVAKLAVTALVSGASPRSFGGFNLLQALKRDECTAESGDPNDFTVPTCPSAGAARNIFSSISESFVMIARARGAKINPTYGPTTAGIDYFLSLQCANGGFTTQTIGGSGCASDIDATGYAMQALRALGGHSAQLRSAASWLMSKRNRDGSWTSQGGHNIDSTALAAAGLHAAGRHVPKSINWLVRQQVRTGPTVGKGASRGALKYQGKYDPAASVKATADGIFGITRADLATLRGVHAWRRQTVLALAAPHVAHRTVLSGHVERVRGTGFAAHERVLASIHGERVGSAVSNSHGTVRISFVVGTGRVAGKHIVKLTGHRSKLSSHASFRIRK